MNLGISTILQTRGRTGVALIAAALIGGSALITASATESGSSIRATPSRDFAKEEKNLQIVLTFHEAFFNRHEIVKAAEVVAEDYIQHNPSLADGKSGLVSFFTSYFKENPQFRSRIVRSAVVGDQVFLHNHNTNGANDRGQASMDIFRVVDGKLVEHWDVVQEVPQNSANGNTMF